MISGSIHQEDTIIINIRISKHREQILTNLKEAIDFSKMIILNFNTLLSIMIYTRQKINNDVALQTNQA